MEINRSGTCRRKFFQKTSRELCPAKPGQQTTRQMDEESALTCIPRFLCGQVSLRWGVEYRVRPAQPADQNCKLGPLSALIALNFKFWRDTPAASIWSNQQYNPASVVGIAGPSHLGRSWETAPRMPFPWRRISRSGKRSKQKAGNVVSTLQLISHIRARGG